MSEPYDWSSHHWIIFSSIVSTVLLLDLFVFHKKDTEPTLKESAFWTLGWCSVALSFNALVYYWAGEQKAIEFLSGYVVEWSLSMDNVFVFVVIFNFFQIPLKNQHRVLFWGILGAIILRLIFVMLGAELIHRFEWIMWVFGAFLVFTGIKLMLHSDEDLHPENNILYRLGTKFFNIHPSPHNHEFFVRENGKTYATNLFLVLLVIESSDVLFAIDSVPAIFGITRDPFIVFSSNIFAILGLRSLYFLLAGVMHLFRFLKYGLSLILIFVGLKMVVDFWLPNPNGGHWLSPGQSLAVIASILTISILASVLTRERKAS